MKTSIPTLCLATLLVLSACGGDAGQDGTIAPPITQSAVFTSIARHSGGNALIDVLAATHLPRGGQYVVAVRGRNLGSVGELAFSRPEVTGSVVTRSDTLLLVAVTSTTVPEDASSTVAAIPNVNVTYNGTLVGTLQIVQGPAPVITLRIVNSVVALRSGTRTIVEVEADVLHAENAPTLTLAREGFYMALGDQTLPNMSGVTLGYGHYTRRFSVNANGSAFPPGGSYLIGYSLYTYGGLRGLATVLIPVTN